MLLPFVKLTFIYVSMKRKRKQCNRCKENKYLFAKKMCLPCYKATYPEKFKIAPYSKKTISRREKYDKLRKEYLSLHQNCEFPNCTAKSIEIHHICGRVGENLFRFFLAVCRPHHRWIHDNPKEAKELGLLC